MGLPPRPGEHDDDHDHDDHDPEAHADEERDKCPSGTWCAEIADAELFSVEGAERELRCPKKLVPNPTVEMPPGDKRFQGFSRSIDMRAELDRKATLDRRNAGEDDVCCYDWLEHCLGRPPLTQRGALVAPAVRGVWLARAQLEWFSVASFVRMARALARRGAPRSLVDAHVLAAKQEQIHAELCCELAGVDPSALPALPELDPLDDTLMIREALVSGAVGESLAVAEALREAAMTKGREREVWERIARDEAGHAALGMATAAWWAERAGPDALTLCVQDLQRAELGEHSLRVLGSVVLPLLEQLGVVSPLRA